MKKEYESSSPPPAEVGGARTAETLLRVVPVCLSLAALVVMIRNSQDNDFGKVSYSNLMGFRYLVYANALCAAYSLVSAFFTMRPGATPSSSRAWAIFFFDQVVTYVILAAGSAATEVLYLAYNGNEAVVWSEACEAFGGFCHRATASVGITFSAAACYFAISLLSSFRLFSTFDPPASASGAGVEVAAFSS